MSTFQTEFGNGSKIIIPSIQRDYIQPLNDSIINGLVDVLVKAYANGETKDLNYLYGINDADGNFIPIDGQQRLTTLWLLHLYVAARLGYRLNTTIEYQTRDISGDFCNALSDKLASLNFELPKISDEIKDANWFIGCWEESVTVKSMLICLDVIHRIVEIEKVALNILWANMNAGEKSSVRFAFHNPTDLGKDIYVKMNSRGKALTQFENLKSWLDDKLKGLCKKHISHSSFAIEFYNKWRVEMDNDWTDFFWRNRNRSAVFPEEIDDSQLRLFYTIAYVIWAQKEPKSRIQMNLNKEEEFDAEAVLSRMRNSILDIPIYELNRLNIFNEEFFLFARRAINGLIKLESILKESIQANTEEEKFSKVYFWELPDNPLKFIYQLLLSEKEEKIAYPKIALAASLLLFASEGINGDELLEWMRFSRNIVNNTDIEKRTIHNVLIAFRKWAKQLKRKGWNKFIKELRYHSGINQSQIDEEKSKFDWLELYPECRECLHRLENHRFFFGRISFLMNYIKEQNVEDSSEEGSLFNSYAQILFKLFDSDGPNRYLYGDDLRSGHRFHRAVLALSEYHGYGVWSGSNWVFSNTKEDWKKYLEDFDHDENGNPHNIGFTRLLSELKGHKESEYSETIKNVIHTQKNFVSDWRQDLICYHDLWDYMESKNIRFDGNNKVFLIRGVALGKRNRRSELRSRGLYSYLKKEIFKDENEQGAKIPLNGWSFDFWDWYGSDRKNSCLFFQKNLNDQVIVADVYFDTTQDIENAYCIEIFDRKAQKEQNREILELSLHPYENLLNKHNFVWSEYYVEKRNLSRIETIDFLKEFIQYQS